MPLDSRSPEVRAVDRSEAQVRDLSSLSPGGVAGTPLHSIEGSGPESERQSDDLPLGATVLRLDADYTAYSLLRGDLLRLHPHDPSRVIIARVEELKALPGDVRMIVSRLASPAAPAPAAAPCPLPDPPLRLLP